MWDSFISSQWYSNQCLSSICFLFRKENGDSIGLELAKEAEAYGTSIVFAVNLRYYYSSAKIWSFVLSWVPMSMNAIKKWYFLRMKYLNFPPESQTLLFYSQIAFWLMTSVLMTLHNSLFEGWYPD